MRPSYHPEGLYDENKVSTGPKERTNPITQLWHMNEKCPEDTIPIRRAKKDDVLRASSVIRYGKKKNRIIPKPKSTYLDLVNQSGHQASVASYKENKSLLFQHSVNIWKNVKSFLFILLFFQAKLFCFSFLVISMLWHILKGISTMEPKQPLMFGNLKSSSIMSSVCLNSGYWVVLLVRILTALKWYFTKPNSFRPLLLLHIWKVHWLITYVRQGIWLSWSLHYCWCYYYNRGC
jgi:hypothetical protein